MSWLFDELSGLWRTADLDPPWPEKGGGVRGAQAHYDVASPEQILRVIRASGRWRPFPNAHVYTWVTDNYLEAGLWLMKQLGVTYKRTFQWVKVAGEAQPLDFATGLAVKLTSIDQLRLRKGIGQYGRGAHEMMLFGTVGSGFDEEVMSEHRDVPSVFFAPNPADEHGQRIHSRKPPAHYELIERRSHGPYQEFFARISRPGWLEGFGNQAPQEGATS